MTRFRLLAAALVAVALAAGCTAGDQGDDADGEAGSGTAATTPAATGPAPGVTDDAIKIGVTYLDIASLGDVVDIDHGDYEAVYTALFDAINAEGGIHGRTVDPVLLPINPVGTDSAEAACVQLTEDEESFIVMGFFLDDAVTCIVGRHATAVVGGSMSEEFLAQAQAPWFTTDAGSDATGDAVQAMVDGGVFEDHTLGVFAGQGDQTLMDDVVLPLLEESGVEVADSAVNDTDGTDTNATNAQTAVIAERFEAAGVDQVLTVGQSGLTWALGAEPLGFRPQLLLTNPNSILAFSSDAAAHDLSILDDAIAGNLYGGPQNLYETDAMQACLGVLADAGIETPSPDSLGPNEGDLFQAAFTGCTQVSLLRALLEAAGEDLNYGTLAAGADGLVVELPNQPEPVTYGPPPAADGDPPMYLFDWDPDAADFVLSEG